ncbi:7051_t:CDS:2, partial [Cetraspora pellucida]
MAPFCPSARERFYLQLLLTTIHSLMFFEHLRTINNTVYPIFKSACIALGLLENNQEWFYCLKEAAILHTESQLRLHFRVNLCDDFRYHLYKNYNIHEPTNDQVFDFELFLLDKILYQSNQSLDMFPLIPFWKQNWGHHNKSYIIAEQLAWNYQKLQNTVDKHISLLNSEQATAYYIIVDLVVKQDSQLFFLNGHAGTDKTFVYNTIAIKIRSLRKIILCIASLDIAALLFDLG